MSRHMIEVLQLYPVDEDGTQRAFDAACEDGGWAGLLRYDAGWEEPRIYVFVDREDPLGDSYAVRPGRQEEIIDDKAAAEIIVRALTGMPYRPRGVWTADGFHEYE